MSPAGSWPFSKARSPAQPDVPTIAEAGVPGYLVDSWQGIFVPKKTPPEIINKMSADTVAALADPAVVQQLAQLAYAAKGSSPDEMRDFLKADADKWSAVIKAANLKVD